MCPVLEPAISHVTRPATEEKRRALGSDRCDSTVSGAQKLLTRWLGGLGPIPCLCIELPDLAVSGGDADIVIAEIPHVLLWVVPPIFVYSAIFTNPECSSHGVGEVWIDI